MDACRMPRPLVGDEGKLSTIKIFPSAIGGPYMEAPSFARRASHMSLLQKSLAVISECLCRESVVRHAHHDNCHPEPVEGWIPAPCLLPTGTSFAGMTAKASNAILLQEPHITEK